MADKAAYRKVLLAILLVVLVLARGVSAEGDKPVDWGDLVKRQFMPKVAELRGLPFLRPVPVKAVSQEEVAAYVRQTLSEQVTEDELNATQRILAYMGLLDPAADLRELLIDAYKQQIAGYYDDKEKTFSIVTDSQLAGELDAVTVVHELTHALQDQHYDLEQLRNMSRDNDDLSLALMSLAEGDASDIMLRYATRSYPRGQGPPKDYSAVLSLSMGTASIPSLPMVITQNITFPYKYGGRFIAQLSKRAGDAGIDAAFLQPPLSTEQVMEPDKYFQKDEPYVIEMPDLSESLPAGWRLLDQSSLGVFNLGLYLVNSLGSWEIEEVLRPWKGDTMAAYAGPRGDDFLFLYYSTWDSQEAAGSFARTYRRLLETRFGGLRQTSEKPGVVTWTSGSTIYQLRQSGADVVSVENVPVQFAAQVILGLRNSQKVPVTQEYPIMDRDRVQPSCGDATPRSRTGLCALHELPGIRLLN